MKNKIVSINELNSIVVDLKAEGKKVIATSGCFDIIHAGHIEYLEEASKHGDVFILFLNSDSSVRQLKGDTRPIVSQMERATVIAALGCVDYVCLFDETTPCEVIKKVKPQSFIKGGDYKGKIIPEMEVMKEYGGVVEYVSLVDGCSTTNIIEKIRQLYS